MDITPLFPKNKNVITSYGSEGFKINGKHYNGALMVSPDKIFEISLNSLDEIDLKILSQIIDFESEILLIGTGNNHQRISYELKDHLKSHFPTISIDEMASSAACRTYNILMAEDRNVVVILLPLQPK